MKYPTSLQDKKYPEFIRKSIITKAFPKPEKVFPRIGLKNSEKLVSSLKISPYLRCKLLWQSILEMPLDMPGLAAAITDKAYIIAYTAIEEFMCAMECFFEDHNYNNLKYEDIIHKSGSEYYIRVPNDYSLSFNGNATIKLDKSRDIIKFIQQAQAYSKKNKLNLKAFESFKPTVKHSSLLDISPVKGKNVKVVFSSNGNKGVWDIATMAERGITSCMHWGKSNHNTKLVGSIVDPYAGIIYLTDGTKTAKGEKMIARSVVRLVASRGKNPKLSLFLEPVYLSNEFKANRDTDREKIGANVAAIFTAFLNEKVRDIRIVEADIDDDNYEHVIPTTEQIAAIMAIEGMEYVSEDNSNWLSYRDSGIEYVEHEKFYDPKKIKLSDFKRA